MSSCRKVLAVGLVAVLTGAGFSAAQPKDGVPAVAAAKADGPQYIRVQEAEGGKHLRLELVIRDFARPDGKGPVVSMAGAVHIADQSFYETLQQELDTKDVVLFEGVKPPGVGRAEHDLAGASDAARAEATKKRERLLGAMVVAFKTKHGEYPASVDALAEQGDKRIAWLVGSARKDGWGHELIYTVEAHAAEAADGGGKKVAAFDIVSYGADGQPGGDGAAADLAFSDQKPLGKEEQPGGGEGIQEQMAKALGLVFQLKAMDHSKANWRNSDLSVDQVQERLDKAGADSGMLFRMLDGSSPEARLLGWGLRFIGSNPTWSAMAKLMMVSVLSRADEMMAAMPGGMGAMMTVIVKDRNAVVIEDLRQVIESEPNVRTIGIIYGAGHLADMEQRLCELGYARKAERWITAIDADVTEAGMTPAQAARMRGMFDRMIEQQMRAARPRQ